jgi:phage terminase large subunit GpA-like protein
MITSEYLADEVFKGRRRRVWKEAGPNHALDCRVYAMAMAEYLGITRMRPDAWARLKAQRATPKVLAEPDLLAPEPVREAAAPPPEPIKPALIGQPVRRKRRVLSQGID